MIQYLYKCITLPFLSQLYLHTFLYWTMEQLKGLHNNGWCMHSPATPHHWEITGTARVTSCRCCVTIYAPLKLISMFTGRELTKKKSLIQNAKIGIRLIVFYFLIFINFCRISPPLFYAHKFPTLQGSTVILHFSSFPGAWVRLCVLPIK